MSCYFETEDDWLNFLRRHSEDALVEMISGMETHTRAIVENKHKLPEHNWDREIQNLEKVMSRMKDVILEKQERK